MGLLLLLPTQALAGIEDSYGFGSRATALGGAFSALADDLSAAWYNPAGLALAESSGAAGIDLHVGVLWVHPALQADLARIDGTRLVFDGAPVAGDVDHGVEPVLGFNIAAGFDFGRILGLDGIHLGVAVHVPAGVAFRWDVIGPQELTWTMYRDRTQRMSILPALALRPHPTVGFGVGVRVTLDNETNSESVLRQNADGTLTAELGNAARAQPRAAPYIGLLVEPLEWLRLAVTVRAALDTEDFGYTDVDATRLESLGLASFGYSHRFSRYYSPVEVTVGLGLHFEPVRITADVTWSAWSDFVDPSRAGERLSDDTVTPRFGVATRVHRSTELMAGYSYYSTPFDNRAGWANLVDNDKHIAAIGTRTELAAFGGPNVSLSWHAQAHVLRDRREVKDWTRFESEAEALANPGWPGWNSGGWLLNLGLSVDVSL